MTAGCQVSGSSAHRANPALIVLPEVYNTNPHIRLAANGYVDDGFVVIAPDIYYLLAPGIRQLSAIYAVIAIVDAFIAYLFYSTRCEAPGLA